jgi:hypothetical protein
MRLAREHGVPVVQVPTLLKGWPQHSFATLLQPGDKR